ncbi:MAG: UvrD-helicase domain-containing protein [Rhizobacter sp.]
MRDKPLAQPAYRIDGAEVSCEAFYTAACDPRRSVAVEACAGAGKTWMLVSRIVRALLEGAAPQDILAITFTRKAAGEMRTRLDEWLAAFSTASCDDGARARELQARGLAPDAARALAPALGGLQETLLRSGRSVEIRTFHAWFSQLLRAAPIELLSQLGLHADMEIVEDMADHWPAILRRFHAAVLNDASLRDAYEALVRQRGRAQVRRWLDNAWEKRIEIQLADAAGTLEPSVPAAGVHWPEHAALRHPSDRVQAPAIDAALRRAAAAMASDSRKTCRQQGEALGQALLLDAAGPRFAAARAALFTLDGRPRQKLDVAGVAEATEWLADIHRGCLQQSAHEEHVRMVRLARALLAEATAYKRSRGLADMADLERCALALLRGATLAGWVQERLDSRVRHLLIDEFQDTSPLQWHAVHAWLSGYAGAGGGISGQRPPAVFIVGDPKQSIYRFRRAEPRVFGLACDFIVQGLGGQLLACDHTRRNAPEVLGVINSVFEAAQQGGEFSGFRRHTTEHPPRPDAGVFRLPWNPRPPGTVAADSATNAGATVAGSAAAEWRDSLTRGRIEVEERIRQPEADAVAAAVRSLLGEGAFRPGEIHVLCRKRESLRLVAQSLAALHVPFAAPEDFPLLESIEARDLLAVVDVLASPHHALSLAQALRSPLFSAGDDDLVALSHAAGNDGDWWAALMRGGIPSAPLQRAAGLLSRWHEAARILPPHDLLDQVVAEGEFRERVAAAVQPERRVAALGAVDALLGLALTLDGARYATPYNFVRALRRRAVSVAAPVQRQAVQLLTVHGAKGLEAEVVFVIDSDPEPRASDSATLLIEWPVASPFPTLCAFTYSELNCAPSLEPLRDREFAARRREELNGLYVAMTRARERLVFSATEPSRLGLERSWWQRIDASARPWPELASGAAVPSGEDVITITSLPRWTPPALAPGGPAGPSRDRRAAPGIEQGLGRGADPGAGHAAIVAYDADADAASRLGQAVHRVLEWAAGPLQRGAPALPGLASAAAREFCVPAAEVARIAAAIWGSPACARFFRGEALRWAGNEVSVADSGDVLRIDRLVLIDDGGGAEWWVLDYKLRHAPERLEEHREQLLRYRRAVQWLQPGAPVRCAFVTGEGAVVEIAAPSQAGSIAAEKASN